MTSFNRCSENVAVKAIIVPELEFRNVEWHILFADLVERADNTAFEDAPETLNRLSVDSTDNVLAFGMVNGCVRIILAKMAIADPLVGAEQADLLRDGLVDESLQGCLPHVANHASDHVPLALDSANNNRLSAVSGGSGQSIPLVPMAVLGLAANESFVEERSDEAIQLSGANHLTY